jgi:hypothetical protein
MYDVLVGSVTILNKAAFVNAYPNNENEAAMRQLLIRLSFLRDETKISKEKKKRKKTNRHNF